MLRSALLPAGLIALATLAACSKGGETDETDVVDTCDVNVASTFPVDGEMNAYYRGPIEITLSGEDPTATVTVTTGGTAVAGTTEWRGTKTLVFTPSAPLAPATKYDVAISFCGGAPAVSFTTSSVGGTADAATLVGKVYALDLASGRFVQPEGVGPLLQGYLTTSVLVSVDSVSADKIKMVGAVAVADSDPPAQDPCSRTIDFPEADFSENPYFAVGPQDTTLQISDYAVDITQLFVSGSFAPDQTYIDGAVLSGSLDTRPLVPILDPEGEDGAICDIAASIGVACEPCADAQNYCLSLYVDSIKAALIPDAVVTPINEVPAECGP
jgi:hypothetical protein